MKNSGIIRLTDISKSYYLGKERVQVLDKVSLSLASGCFTVIAGPSGSGKSTLLNILGCLDLPESGEYLLNDNPVDFRKKTKLAELRKENFGFIFQSFNLIPVLTAQENVELPLTLFGLNEKEIRERAQGMLDLVGLADKFRNKPSEMSGGQQQRVAIARAMVSNPKIIFADEPTANLDRKTATKIIDLMLNLNEEKGISFVFASHDDLVISSAKELFKVNSGKIELNHDIMIS